MFQSLRAEVLFFLSNPEISIMYWVQNCTRIQTVCLFSWHGLLTAKIFHLLKMNLRQSRRNFCFQKFANLLNSLTWSVVEVDSRNIFKITAERCLVCQEFKHYEEQRGEWSWGEDVISHEIIVWSRVYDFLFLFLILWEEK